MTSVFVGGSRRCSRLDAQVRERLDTICRKDMFVLVGDASGVDKAVQTFLAQRDYRNVIVYCSSDVCRNNVGGWQVRSIATDAKRESRAFYVAKDRAMASDASCGFMVWDGRSKGTLDNMRRLLQRGKLVLAYVTSDKVFCTLRAPLDIDELLSGSLSQPPHRAADSGADGTAYGQAQTVMDFMDRLHG